MKKNYLPPQLPERAKLLAERPKKFANHRVSIRLPGDKFMIIPDSYEPEKFYRTDETLITEPDEQTAGPGVNSGVAEKEGRELTREEQHKQQDREFKRKIRRLQSEFEQLRTQTKDFDSYRQRLGTVQQCTNPKLWKSDGRDLRTSSDYREVPSQASLLSLSSVSKHQRSVNPPNRGLLAVASYDLNFALGSERINQTSMAQASEERRMRVSSRTLSDPEAVQQLAQQTMDTLKQRMPRRSALNLDKLKPSRRRLTSLDNKVLTAANADLDLCYVAIRENDTDTQTLETASQTIPTKPVPNHRSLSSAIAAGSGSSRLLQKKSVQGEIDIAPQTSSRRQENRP